MRTSRKKTEEKNNSEGKAERCTAGTCVLTATLLGERERGTKVRKERNQRRGIKVIYEAI